MDRDLIEMIFWHYLFIFSHFLFYLLQTRVQGGSQQADQHTGEAGRAQSSKAQAKTGEQVQKREHNAQAPEGASA